MKSEMRAALRPYLEGLEERMRVRKAKRIERAAAMKAAKNKPKKPREVVSKDQRLAMAKFNLGL